MQNIILPLNVPALYEKLNELNKYRYLHLMIGCEMVRLSSDRTCSSKLVSWSFFKGKLTKVSSLSTADNKGGEEVRKVLLQKDKFQK